MTESIRDNPLLDFSGLPRFADFKPDWVEPALDTLLAEARDQLAAAAGSALTAGHSRRALAAYDAQR